MTSAREVKLRIASIKNIAQVTRALQAVSASKVRKAMAAVAHTRPYASKAWQVLTHIAEQPGRENLHPLLVERETIKNVTVVIITGDRGLAGVYNTNLIRFALQQFSQYPVPVRYITVGSKGRDMLSRRRKQIIAEFSKLPAAPLFADVSAIGRLAVEEYLSGQTDKVFLVYTDFVNMVTQNPVIKQLLPLEYRGGEKRVEEFVYEQKKAHSVYLYEPSETEILDQIIPRFTALQVYQAILESLASEHAARMIAMKNATDSAAEFASVLQLEYNKARQQAITNEMLDIAGGAEALTQ